MKLKYATNNIGPNEQIRIFFRRMTQNDEMFKTLLPPFSNNNTV
jgi:hypothetical protein